MNILVTSGAAKDTLGSWTVRGIQLGNAIGAQVVNNASNTQIAQADIVIVVKKIPNNIKFAKYKILDIVDTYPQPASFKWSKEQLIGWAADVIKPFDDTVSATYKMQQDLNTNFWLRHHYRPGIVENQIRNTIKIVGYEGSVRYLGNYRNVLEQACIKRGWRFVINPSQLAHCDLIVAVRDNDWRGYASDNWKSSIKMSNAIGSLTPLLALPEQGYLETGAPFFKINSIHEIDTALDQAADFNTRISMAEQYKTIKPKYDINTIAEEYLQWITNRL